MTRNVTFVHAADLHLDAPFGGIQAEDERVRSALVEATYEAFTRIVDLAVERDVDFVVFAGDVYNSRDKSLRAQLRFQSGVRRLADAGIAVFLVQGNHDPANGWSAGLALPDLARYFPTSEVGRFEVEREGELVCTVYGRGYGTAAVTENLARGFRRDPADPLAVAVLHANVGGNTDYEPYAPCSLEDLRAAGMDYWALGHIHKPGVLVTDPTVVYAGSPQGLNPKEDGAHGCYVVSLSEQGADLEFIETASVSWHRAELDLSDCADLGDARQRIARECASIREAADSHAVARIDLVGRSGAHADLSRPGALDDLVEDVRTEGLAEEPWLWIDRLRDLTRAPVDIDTVRSGADFAADLVRTADDLLAHREEAASVLDGIVAPLGSTLGGYEPSEGLDRLVERARDLCLDLLLGEEDDR